MKERRIICFTDSLGSGGAQRQLVGLSCLLKEHGYNVSVLLYYDNPFYKNILDENGIESVVVCNSNNYLKRLWRIYLYLKQFKDCTIIAYQGTPSIISCILKPFIHCRKLIVSERNTTQRITRRDKIKYWLWRFADVIVPNSYTETKFIKEHVPQVKNKLVTITNFVDTNKFAPLTRESKQTPNLFNIVTVARVAPQKNVLNYIKAIKLATDNITNIKFEVNWYGVTCQDDYYHRCNDLIKQFNLQDTFHFHEATNDIANIYCNGDVFCLPSIYEGFPNVICEAMSCGMPVLCGNVCDNGNIVVDGNEGLLFNPNNVSEIADAIMRYCLLPEFVRDQMRAKCRHKALLDFSADSFINKYIKILK